MVAFLTFPISHPILSENIVKSVPINLVHCIVLQEHDVVFPQTDAQLLEKKQCILGDLPVCAHDALNTRVK